MVFFRNCPHLTPAYSGLRVAVDRKSVTSQINDSGKTNIFRGLSLVGELLENKDSDTISYHHNGNLNNEYEVKIGIQFDEDEIEALHQIHQRRRRDQRRYP
jgi:hypothetical protein